MPHDTAPPRLSQHQQLEDRKTHESTRAHQPPPVWLGQYVRLYNIIRPYSCMRILKLVAGPATNPLSTQPSKMLSNAACHAERSAEPIAAAARRPAAASARRSSPARFPDADERSGRDRLGRDAWSGSFSSDEAPPDGWCGAVALSTALSPPTAGSACQPVRLARVPLAPVPVSAARGLPRHKLARPGRKSASACITNSAGLSKRSTPATTTTTRG